MNRVRVIVKVRELSLLNLRSFIRTIYAPFVTLSATRDVRLWGEEEVEREVVFRNSVSSFADSKTAEYVRIFFFFEHFRFYNISFSI